MQLKVKNKNTEILIFEKLDLSIFYFQNNLADKFVI